MDFEVGGHVLCIDNECVEDLIEQGKVYTVSHIQVSTELIAFKNNLYDNVLLLCLEEVVNIAKNQKSNFFEKDVGFNALRFKPLKKINIDSFLTKKVDELV